MTAKKIVIVTDSSAYIPESAMAGLEIAVIPLWLLWEGDSLRDGIDILPPEFYRRLPQAASLPTSSQPTAGEFVAFFRQVAAAGADQIVAVLVSEKISGTITSAQAAVVELPDLDIRVVDSWNSSMGLGHVVLAAARAAAAGADIEQVVAAAEQMRQQIQFLFVVDTLEYLHKGGRIGGAKRLLGTALKIKPLLHFQDGQIEPLEQARTQQKAYVRLLQLIEQRLAGKAMAEATVVDVDCRATGDAIAEKIQARFGPLTIHRAQVSPVVGTHVGPGTIGVAFYAVSSQ